jgi:uncharacterized protein YutE (UPF0331/DUF86 family)
VVDRERVARLLDHLRADSRALAELRGRADADGLVLDAVKYRFVTAIEGCARIAHHICASEGWSAPDTNADAVRALVAHGVIDAATGESIAKAMGFRNILVHQYTEVDDDRVLGYLSHVSDLDEYAVEVADWLLKQ